MDKLRIIQTIIFLPDRFYTEGNVSIYALLKESGYFELHDQISETDIFEGLAQHIKSIDQWLSWSEDKRSSSGWYFKQNDNKKFSVGYFPPNEDLQTVEYIDKTEACAAFIKREIENIRKSW